MLQECKTVALKRRKASSRLENLGIPEEELLRQQQELFAKVRTIKGIQIMLWKLERVFDVCSNEMPSGCSQLCTSGSHFGCPSLAAVV